MLAPLRDTAPLARPANLADALRHRAAAFPAALTQLAEDAAVHELALALVRVLRRGGKILVAGNGGSAAEAQHFAAELVGRFSRERSAFPVIALHTDTSVLTALANDYGYPHVFARQIEALGGAADALLLFSTSGESENLILAADAARRRAMTIAAAVGEGRSSVARISDIVVRVPLADAPLVQELQLVLTHVICAEVERALTSGDGR